MIAFIACALLAAVQPDDDHRPKELRDLESLRQDVEMLRTLNDLKITKDQGAKLLAAAEAGRKKIADAMKDAGDAIETVTKSLQAQREALLKGEALNEEDMHAFHEAQGTLGQVYHAMEEAAHDAAAEVRKILDAGQLAELAWIRRHDPVAQVRRWAKQSMTMMRRIPEEAFEEHGKEMVENFFEHLPMLPAEDKPVEVERVVKILGEARGLADEEFAKKSAELVDRIVTEGKIGDFAKGVKEPPNAENELGRFILQPRVARLLKERK